MYWIPSLVDLPPHRFTLLDRISWYLVWITCVSPEYSSMRASWFIYFLCSQRPTSQVTFQKMCCLFMIFKISILDHVQPYFQSTSSTTSCCLHHFWVIATHSSPVHHHHIKPFLSFDGVSRHRWVSGGWRAFLRSFRDLEVAVLSQCHQGGDCSPPVSSVTVDGSEIRLTSWGYQVGSLSHYFTGFCTSKVVQDFFHFSSTSLV